MNTLEPKQRGQTYLHDRQRAAWCTEKCKLAACDEDSPECVANNVRARRRAYFRQRYLEKLERGNNAAN